VDDADALGITLSHATYAFRERISSLISGSANQQHETGKYDGYGLEQLLVGSSLDYSKIFTDVEWEPKYNLYGLDQSRHYDYIFAGCSETEGSFLTSKLELADIEHYKRVTNYSEFSKYIWGNVLGAELKLEGLNLSFGGASAFAMIDRFISYCSTNGSPKVAAMLFPPLTTRIHTAQDFSRFQLDPAEQENATVVAVNAGRISENKYSKAPHLITDVLPPVHMLYHNIRMIKILESYCLVAGIKLAYSTWSYESHYILSQANEVATKFGLDIPFKGYVDTETDIWREAWPHDLPVEIRDCHRELLKDTDPLFWKGSDGDHMGTHRHAHIAETIAIKLQGSSLD
jgi:hypothetical protein